VFGIGTDLTDAQWRGVVRQVLAQGLLGVDGDGYGTLRLTEASAAVLRGERQVPLRQEAARPPRAARSRSGSSSGGGGRAAAAVTLDDSAAAVFERLRAWRAGVAKEQGVPAYVVFHDATLREIATTLPADVDALSTIGGVGATKLDRYGAGVLAAVRGEPAAD
jgi:ATP-dependent DNA helicase RecQ